LGKAEQVGRIVFAFDLDQALEVGAVIGAEVVALGAVDEVLVALI
jgi:hypothetical protein